MLAIRYKQYATLFQTTCKSTIFFLHSKTILFKKGSRAVVDSFKVADKNCVKMLFSMEILCVMVVLHIELRMINRQKKLLRIIILAALLKH